MALWKGLVALGIAGALGFGVSLALRKPDGGPTEKERPASPAGQVDPAPELVAAVISSASDPALAEPFIRAIGGLGVAAVPAVQAKLDESGLSVAERTALACALIETNDPAALGEVHEAWRQMSAVPGGDEARRAILQRLIPRRSPEHVKLLLRLWSEEPEGETKRFLQDALVALGSDALLRPVFESAAGELSLDSGAVGALLSEANQVEEHRREARSLEGLEPEALLARCAAILERDGTANKSVAIMHLGRMGTPETKDALFSFGSREGADKGLRGQALAAFCHLAEGDEAARMRGICLRQGEGERPMALSAVQGSGNPAHLEWLGPLVAVGGPLAGDYRAKRVYDELIMLRNRRALGQSE